jgi:flagellar protein FliO/FliZ
MGNAADFSWIRLFLAFSIVLALLGALGFVLKYIGTRGLVLPTKAARARRMKIVENLTIDTKRRFVIVSCDGREHLLLLSANHDIVVEANLPPVSTQNAP